MKTKVLHICMDNGDHYNVSRKGYIMRCDMPENGYCTQWTFSGVSTHHWHRRIVHNLASIWANPSIALKGCVWDVDHGTTRTWGGKRVLYCYLFEV